MMPRRTIKNGTLREALKNFLVPIISNKYRVCYFRTLWEVVDEDQEFVQLNIWSKRKEVDRIVGNFDNVALFFSCLTGLESQQIRYDQRRQKRKREALNNQASDSEYESFDESSKIIPDNFLH